jgi:hypothetical protein
VEVPQGQIPQVQNILEVAVVEVAAVLANLLVQMEVEVWSFFDIQMHTPMLD